MYPKEIWSISMHTHSKQTSSMFTKLAIAFLWGEEEEEGPMIREQVENEVRTKHFNFLSGKYNHAFLTMI